MTLKSIIGGAVIALGLATSLSNPLSAQTTNMAVINPVSTETTPKVTEQLVKPTSKPLYAYNLTAHKIRSNGRESGQRQAGTIEIYENALYAELLFGVYKILYVRDNDSTFTTYQSTNILWYSQLDKVVETRTDSTRLKSIFTTKEDSKRKENLNTAYSKEYLPLMQVVQEFLNNENHQLVKTISIGTAYDLPFQETYISSNKVLTKADIADLIKQETGIKVELENPMHFLSEIKQGKKIPYHAEGRATISNTPDYLFFLEGNWRVTATLAKKD